MIFKLLVCLFVFSSTQINSQEWFPVGASWYYNQTIFFPPGNGYVYMEVTGEVIINGKLYRIVSGGCFCGEQLGNYLHQDGDKIYRYDPETNQSSLLYDFTLQPGDTMSYYSEITDVTNYVLDSISYLILDSTSLRVQHFTKLEGWLEMGTTIYELIGSAGCLYPQIGFCDPLTGGLRCYEDTIVGLQKFIQPEMECDYVTGTFDLNVPNLVLYPNPATNIVTIEASDIISVIQLIDLSGNTLLTEACEIEYCMLNIQHYVPGMFFLKITFKDGSIVVRKVIIAK